MEIVPQTAVTADEAGNVSNEVLLNVVQQGLPYEMMRDVLVKPLATVKVKRMTNVPKKTDEVDEEGQPIMEMEMKEIEVDSAFRTGIILALPTGVDMHPGVVVGATIAFPHKYSIDFDLFKDSVLVKPYDIIALVK